MEVTSDASGSYGCGALSIMHGWFQLKWPNSWDTVDITVKEMVPVIVAAALWGHKWRHTCIRFCCDNMAVVSILKSHTSHNYLLMHLIQCLMFYSAFFGFNFVAEHIPGLSNTAADAISHNISLFTSLFPQVPQVPIPEPVVELLVVKWPDWGSSAWTQLFWTSLQRASPSQPGQCTGQGGAGT